MNLRFLSLWLSLLFLAACGGETISEDPCAEVECARGVCEANTLGCVNPGTCDGDSECLEGYLCTGQGCAAQVACAEDADCERGLCVQGACINAATCSSTEQCVHGFRCSGGDCVSDRCASVDCERGVCNPDTGACANSVVCTQGTQTSDCIDGYFCYGQSCELAEQICEEIECRSGICDPATAKCANAPDCEGSDRRCLEGYYCADDGTCEVNRCDAEMQTCPRGVCDPSTGGCVHAERCTALEECLNGSSCVAGACVAAGEECGDAGCPGNQVCTYVAEDLEGVCSESGTGCFTTHDCRGTRVCRNGGCRPSMICENDAFEPNDLDSEGVRVADLPRNMADGTLCESDVDVFRFHTDESPLFRGLLVVDARIVSEDLGAGDMIVEVVYPDGTMVMASTAGSDAARVVRPITVLELGEYVVRVRGESNVFASGLRYSLFVDMLDQSAVDACEAALPLGNTPVMGNSSSGASFLLGSECTTPGNAAGEDVYAFELEETSWVDVSIDPAAGVDISASIRRRCEVTDDLVCANERGADAVETLRGALLPGRYYLVVQGADPGSGGSYDLDFSALPVVCGNADAACVNPSTSRFCNPQGTGFEQLNCELGCDETLGLCTRVANDVCYTATDATNGLSESIRWADYGADYDPGVGSCVPSNEGTQTDGPDVAYRVEIGADEVLVADLSLAFGDFGSLYLVSDCGDLAGSCVAGANAETYGNEQLVYFNTTGAAQTLYVVADVEADSFGHGTGGITIGVHPQVCTPGVDQCAGDILQICDAIGSSFEDRLCTFGCVSGACNPLLNDVCGGAVALDDGVPFTGRIDEYGTDVAPNFSSCTQRSASGPDALFTITPAAGEVATVTVTADFDVALLVSTDCADPVTSCIEGSDAISTNEETVQFVGDGTTYTVVVDSSFRGNGLFTISATKQMPSCQPGESLGCATGTSLSYCTPLGVPAFYGCASTCTGSACDAPTGEICYDPLVVPSTGMSVTSSFDGRDDINPGTGTVGACDFGSVQGRGVDRVYAVDLTPGDFLFAEFVSGSGSAMMYLLPDCGDTSSCLDRSANGTQGSLVYEALTNERVYLVMDRTVSGTSTLTYTLDVDIRRQNCTPGSLSYCTDSTTLAYCDNLGFTRNWTCSSTCTSGSCDDPTGDVCVDPIPVVNGQTVMGNWMTGTNTIQPRAPIDGTCPFDSGQEPDGREDVYRIDLNAGDLLRVDLTTSWGSAYVYILEDCLDTASCRDVNYQGGAGVVYYYARTAGPVSVVVDSSSSFSSTTPYTVSFDVTSGSVCAPDESWCDAGGNVMVCDGSGAFVKHTFPCANGCSNGACTVEPTADACATAPTVVGGTLVYGSFANLANDITRTSTGCTGGASAGPDTVYAVTAGPGEVIHAELWSWGTERVELSVLGDCTDPANTCLAGSLDPDYDQVEVYFAPSAPGTYYVVADSTSSTSDEPFTLFIEVLPTECAPQSLQCSANGQTLRACNEHGLWEDYPCDGGCMNNQCGMPTGAVCYDAMPMVNGSRESGEYRGEANLAPSGSVGSCAFAAGDSPVGPERVFSVDLKAGDVLEAAYTSTSSFGIMYLMSDCWDVNSCIDNTTGGSSGTLRYRAPQDETVFVVMDRTTSPSSLTWDVTITVLTPDCTPGSAATCADADTITYCDALGFSQEYDCGGASPTCSAGACASPVGGACVDAVTLTDGSSVSGTFQGTNAMAVGPGAAGTCSFGSTNGTVGIDHFYRVDLLAGEVLLADYTSASASGLLYLLTDCLDGTTCLDNTDQGTSGRLTYTATQDETVYLVIDRTTSNMTSLGWTLDIIVALPVCAPGAQQCAADGTTLEWCNDLGLWETYACNGTCSQGACDTPSGDACVDAIPVSAGAVIMDTYVGTNASDLGGGFAGQCDFMGRDQPGTDHFYRIDLLAGQSLNVAFSTNSTYGMLLLMGDCNEASTCLGATNSGGSGALNYNATVDETVFVVMDRTLSGSTASYDYTLTFTVN